MLYIVLFILLLYVVISATKADITRKSPTLKVYGYNLFYTDQKCEHRKDDVIYSKLLESEKYGIYGKPDFIYKRKSSNSMIPIELKSGSIGKKSSPNKGDLMQLFAYILICEDVFGAKVKEGRLIYNDAMFVVRNTAKMRRELENTLSDMRSMLKSGLEDIEPNFVYCRYCVCRDIVCKL